MHVSALIVTHSDIESFSRCLNALWAQTRRPDTLIVVANGVPPHYRVEDLVGPWASEQVTVVRLRDNGGAAGGFEAGIEQALSAGLADAVCCFDDDAIPEPDCLDALLTTLGDSETAGCIGALTHCGGDALAWPLYEVGSPKPLTTVDEARAASSPDGTISTYALSWHALLLPVSTVMRVGNVCGRLFHQYEDAEYGFRIRRAGLENLVSIGAKCVHPASPHTKTFSVLGRQLSVGQSTPSKEYLSIRNSLLVRHRYDGSRFWYRSLPEITMRAILSIATQDSKRFSLFVIAALSAYWHALRGRTGAPPPRLGPL